MAYIEIPPDIKRELLRVTANLAKDAISDTKQSTAFNTHPLTHKVRRSFCAGVTFRDTNGVPVSAKVEIEAFGERKPQASFAEDSVENTVAELTGDLKLDLQRGLIAAKETLAATASGTFAHGEHSERQLITLFARISFKSF